MKVYCAETGDINSRMLHDVHPLPKFNLLTSYYYTKDIKPYLPFINNLLIDSGAFTLQQRKSNYDKYFKDYKQFVEEHYLNPKIQGFFELDIHEKVGYDKVLDYRRELFEITDKIIPVWHKNLGLHEYKKMCNDYNYISVSCVKDRSIPRDKYINFVKYAHQHNTKIHGLGMLRPKILDKVPFDTVDGTGWFKASRFGRRGGRKINSDYIRNNRTKLVHLELLDHIQFQEHYYNLWKSYHND